MCCLQSLPAAGVGNSGELRGHCSHCCGGVGAVDLHVVLEVHADCLRDQNEAEDLDLLRGVKRHDDLRLGWCPVPCALDIPLIYRVIGRSQGLS